MKPLPPAPLTPEDLQAWSYCYGFVEGVWWDAVMIYTRLCDRRDAELMYNISEFRRTCYPGTRWPTVLSYWWGELP